MGNNNNSFYYLASLAVFVVLKFVFTFTSINDLFFLLNPTDAVISIITNSSSTFIIDRGFFHSKFNILIDKSCAGYNLWLLSFLIFNFLLLKYLGRNSSGFLSIPASLVLAYLFTVFVNSSRIYTSIIIQNNANFVQIDQNYLHEGIGILTNLLFLILAYYFIEKFLIYKNYDAKST